MNYFEPKSSQWLADVQVITTARDNQANMLNV